MGTLKTYVVTLNIQISTQETFWVKAEDDIRAYDIARERFRESGEACFDPDAPGVDITEYEVREVEQKGGETDEISG